MDRPPLHELCAPLAPLLGVWQGGGEGDYPTIDAFAYREVLTFEHVGKPFVAMSQRTRDAESGAPLHSETGYLRPRADGMVELVVAQPSGILESSLGPIVAADDGVDLDLSSEAVLLAPTAKSVTATRRRLTVTGDVLVSELWMAAVGEDMTHHLRAELRRAEASS